MRWSRPPGASPLCGRPIHDDVDPQDLHGVEGVGQVAHGGQSDEAQGCDAPVGHKRQNGARSTELAAQTQHWERPASTYVLSWNRTKFLMLWKMPLPSSTALLQERGSTGSQGRPGEEVQPRCRLLKAVMVSARGDCMPGTPFPCLLAGILGGTLVETDDVPTGTISSLGQVPAPRSPSSLKTELLCHVIPGPEPSARTPEGPTAPLTRPDQGHSETS